MKRETIQLLTVILTCLATISIALSNRQLSKSTKESVESSIETTNIMKKEFETTNRPYVQILPYKTEFILEENKVIVYFKNWGKSFASNILVDYSFKGLGMPLDWAGRIKYWLMSPGEIISCSITISPRKELSDEVNDRIQKKQLKEEELGLMLRWTYEWQNKTYPQNPEEAIADLFCIIDKETKISRIHYYKSLEIVEMIDKAYKEQLTKVLEAVYVGMSKEDLLEVVGWLRQKGYHGVPNKEEEITFYNWTTVEPDDLVAFYIKDGKVKKWEIKEK